MFVPDLATEFGSFPFASSFICESCPMESVEFQLSCRQPFTVRFEFHQTYNYFFKTKVHLKSLTRQTLNLKSNFCIKMRFHHPMQLKREFITQKHHFISITSCQTSWLLIAFTFFSLILHLNTYALNWRWCCWRDQGHWHTMLTLECHAIVVRSSIICKKRFIAFHTCLLFFYDRSLWACCGISQKFSI